MSEAPMHSAPAPTLRAALLVGLVAALSACGDGPDAGEGSGAGRGGYEIVGGLSDVSGVLVMYDGNGFSLFDPRTTAVSEFQYPAAEPPQASPDGTQLLHRTPNNAILLTRIVADAQGRPTLEQVAAWEGLGDTSGLRFNRYGDRVLTDNHWIRPDTGAVLDCNPQDLFGRNELVPFASGYDFLCGDTRYRDEVAIVETVDPRDLGYPELYDAIVLPTLDGAFDSPMWLTNPLVFRAAELRPQDLMFPHLDGSYWAADITQNGSVHISELGNDGGPVPVPICRTEQLSGRVQWSSRTRFHDNVVAGEVLEDLLLWPLGTALTPYYEFYDSRLLEPLAQHPATGEVLYAVTSSEKAPGCTNSVRERHLVVLDDSGVTFDVAFTEAFDVLGAAAIGTQTGVVWPELRDYRVLPYGEDGFLLPMGGSPSTEGGASSFFAGRIDGELYRVDGSLPGPEGRRAFDVRMDPDAGNVLCVREVLGTDGARCVSYPYTGQPVALLAEGGMPGDAVTAPVVRALSHVGRMEGDVLSVFGAGFGAGGTVLVDDHEVASADVVAWTDRRIDVRVSSSWPERGVLRVRSGGAVSGEGGYARWVARTPRPDVAAVAFPASWTEQQGLNRFAWPELAADSLVDQRSRDADGAFTFFSEGADEAVTEVRRVSLDDDAWLVFPEVTTAPGLADETVWQPIGRASPPDERIPQLGFVFMSGEWIDLGNARRPRLDTRVLLDPVVRTPVNAATARGAPTMVRETPAGTFSYDRVFGTAGARITGWDDDGGALTPQFEPAGTARDLRDFGAVGDLVVATGAGLDMGLTPGGYQLSVDGGRTWGELLTEGVPAVQRPAGLVGPDGAGVLAWYRYDDGTREPVWFTEAGPSSVAAWTIAPDAETEFGRWTRQDRIYADDGPRAVYYRAGASTALVADVSDGTVRVDVLGAPGELRSLTHDPVGRRLIAVTTDGQVWTSPFGDEAITFESVVGEVTLADGTPLDVWQAIPLTEERWLVSGTVAELPTWGSSFGWFAVSPVR